MGGNNMESALFSKPPSWTTGLSCGETETETETINVGSATQGVTCRAEREIAYGGGDQAQWVVAYIPKRNCMQVAL